MDDKNVIKLIPSEDKPPLQVLQKDYRACGHVRFDLHPDQPKVWCRDCNEELDPMFVLRQVARGIADRHWQIGNMKREAEKLAKEVERQMKSRKKAELAERDRRELERLRRIAQANPEMFGGDVQEKQT